MNLNGGEKMKFNYKQPETLEKYLNARGGLKPRAETGLTKKQQKQLETAVKRARLLGLL